MHRSHLGSGALCSTSLRIKYLSKFFKILLHGKIILPLHLFANSIPCLYQYGFRDIYHILQTFNSIPLFFFSLKSFYLWPLGAISVGSGVLLTYLYRCSVVFLFLFCLMCSLSGTTRYSGLILHIPCPSHRISHFFKKHWFQKPISGYSVCFLLSSFSYS